MKTKIFCFDLETTGVNTLTDRIVQIAYLILDASTLEIIGSPVSLIINPQMPISKSSTEIHGITNEMVANEKTFSSVAKELHAVIKDCHIAGYNSNAFDVPLLVNEFARVGVEIPFDDNTLFLDVFQIYRKLFSLKLKDVYERTFGEPLQDAHNALSDVIATSKVFTFLVSHADQWSQFTGGIEDPEWVTYSETDRQYYFVKGKYKGEKVMYYSDYCNWMMGQQMPLNTKAVICKIFGADLWLSLAAGYMVYHKKHEPDDIDELPF